MIIAAVDTVEERLKKLVIQAAHQTIDANRLESETALVDTGLSLDSVSLLELVVGIESEFNIMIDDGVLRREHFESIRSLALAVRREMERQQNRS